MKKVFYMKTFIPLCFLLLGISGILLTSRKVQACQRVRLTFEQIKQNGFEYYLIQSKNGYDDYAVLNNYANAPASKEGILTLPSSVNYQGKTYPVIGINASDTAEEVREVVVPEEFGDPDIRVDFSAWSELKGQSNFLALPNDVPKVTILAKNINLGGYRFNTLWFNKKWYIYIENSIQAWNGAHSRAEAKSESLNNATGLESVVLESEQIHLSRYAFAQKHKLTELSIKKTDAKLSMDSSAFYDCCRLKKLQLPADTLYQEGAINQCYSLDSLELPQKNTAGYTIQDGALLDHKTLLFVPAKCNSYTTGRNINKIGMLAFSNCEKLKKVSTSAAIIGEGAFFRCKKLSKITLKKTRTIGTHAFAWTGIQKITLPSTLKKMGEGVFVKAKSLKSIQTRGKYFKVIDGNLLSRNGKKLYTAIPTAGKVTVPDGVKTISIMAVPNTAVIKEITFPSSVQKLGQMGGKCKNLKKLSFQGKKAPKALWPDESWENLWNDMFYEMGDYSGSYLIRAQNAKQRIKISVPIKSRKIYRNFMRGTTYNGKVKISGF